LGAQALAERIVAEDEVKVGRELLDEFALMFGGLASAFQPVGAGPGETITPTDFEIWAIIGHGGLLLMKDQFERTSGPSVGVLFELPSFSF
jgi:hypothetical protein